MVEALRLELLCNVNMAQTQSMTMLIWLADASSLLSTLILIHLSEQMPPPHWSLEENHTFSKVAG